MSFDYSKSSLLDLMKERERSAPNHSHDASKSVLAIALDVMEDDQIEEVCYQYRRAYILDWRDSERRNREYRKRNWDSRQFAARSVA